MKGSGTFQIFWENGTFGEKQDMPEKGDMCEKQDMWKNRSHIQNHIRAHITKSY